MAVGPKVPRGRTPALVAADLARALVALGPAVQRLAAAPGGRGRLPAQLLGLALARQGLASTQKMLMVLVLDPNFPPCLAAAPQG